MKILLIYSTDNNTARYKEVRTEFPPLGLLYIASSINKDLHQVIILELGQIKKQEFRVKYDLIGLNINSAYSYYFYKKEIKKIKLLASYVIAGGQFATVFYNKVLQELQIDAIVRGEGEEVINRLIQCFSKRKEIHLRGVVTKHNLHLHSTVLRIKNLDNVNFPARNLLSRDEILLNYRVPDSSKYSVGMITARGCPYNCSFCGNLYKKVMFRSSESIKGEIKNLISQYNIEHITLLDENIMFDNKHLRNVCNVFKELKLSWSCNARVDSFTFEKVRMMKLSGCLEVKYGIESGDDSLLLYMRKKITRSQIKRAILGTKECGLLTKGFLLFGFPSETVESINNTICLLQELGQNLDRVNLFNFVPLHNSDCFLSPQQYGLKLKKNLLMYSFYSDYKHWWGSRAEYKSLSRYRSILEEHIQNNYSKNEPILTNEKIGWNV